MANYRLIYDNAANRATVTVSSQASASLAGTNLQTPIKSQVWRSASAAPANTVITLTWPTAELIGAMMLAFSNIDTAGTITAQLYTNIGDASPVVTIGPTACCPAIPVGLAVWGTDTLGVNAYSYGGASCGRLWLPAHTSVRKLVITISNPTNTSGYIEVGRLMVGRFYEGVRNVDYGASMTPVDTTKNSRNDAGDLMSDIGTMHRKFNISLSNMSAAERNVIWNIAWGNGLSKEIFLSIFPNDVDPALEQSHQALCKLMTSPAMAMPSFLQYATSLEFEEV